MNNRNAKYGICLQHCFIENCNLNLEQLHQGDLIQIIEKEVHVIFDEGDKILIRLYNSEENAFKTELFECMKQHIGYIEDALWPYMIGASESNTRIKIYSESDVVLQIKCGTEITINSFENDSNARIKGVIQLIDTVKECGIGNFIGLKILNPPENRLTLLTLYKKYYNPFTSLFLFRIDQLLDAIKTSNIKSLPPLRATCTRGGQVINPLIKSDIPGTLSESNSYFPPAVSSRQHFNNMQQNQSRIDGLNNLNCSPLSSDSCFISKLSDKSNTDNLTQNPNSAIKSTMSLHQNKKANNTSAQLIDVSLNEQLVKSKRNRSVDDKRQNNQYTQNRKIPKNIGFGKSSTYGGKKLNNNKNNLRCNICKSPFDHDTLVLQCSHYICIKCVGNKITSLIGTRRLRCPFVSNSGFSCMYQLQNYEVKQLREKLDEHILMPLSNNRQPNLNTEEELFKCQTERCEGNWYVSKSDSINLFRCPVCKIINCVHCKAIHNNISCTEFKNNRVQQVKLQDVFNKLNNLVLSFKTVGLNTDEEPRQKNSTESKIIETLMKCKTINCMGQWFVSKIDRNSIFKCPICKVYNCANCNAIHQNQTCDEYQEAQRPEYKFQNANVNPDNIMAIREWSCTRCTFINFGHSNICQMCSSNNII